MVDLALVRALRTRTVGDDHFLYASDVPHGDGEFPKNLKSCGIIPIFHEQPRRRSLITTVRSISS